MVNTSSSATRYRSLNRAQALLVIALVSLAMGVCLAASRGIASSDLPSTSDDPSQGDAAFYTRVVQRLHRVLAVAQEIADADCHDIAALEQ